jgi:hypothetical protein
MTYPFENALLSNGGVSYHVKSRRGGVFSISSAQSRADCSAQPWPGFSSLRSGPLCFPGKAQPGGTESEGEGGYSIIKCLCV